MYILFVARGLGCIYFNSKHQFYISIEIEETQWAPCFLEGRKTTCITNLCMHICIETARGGICAGTLRFWWQYSVRNTSRKQLEKVVIQFYCSCSEFTLTCILSFYNLILLKNRISIQEYSDVMRSAENLL